VRDASSPEHRAPLLRKIESQMQTAVADVIESAAPNLIASLQSRLAISPLTDAGDVAFLWGVQGDVDEDAWTGCRVPPTRVYFNAGTMLLVWALDAPAPQHDVADIAAALGMRALMSLCAYRRLETCPRRCRDRPCAQHASQSVLPG